MSNASLNSKVVKATKWTFITEIVSKLITPITSMVLARLLTPDAFGVVTTLTMIIAFAELFTDAGFQKYLIQHDFKDEEDREKSTTVAFWSNFVMSIAIWGIIAIFADPLATVVGNPGLGNVIIIACVSIPLSAFSSIQMALYKRDLDFKTLFKVRVVGILIPLVVTIPLAFLLRSYWALVIGIITTNSMNAILLTVYSKWKPRFFYSFAKLREMLSFTIWSLIESITIWLTGYVDVFIVGSVLSQYYLGLYKTSATLVGQIMGLVTAATTPVLFSALSKLQNDDSAFKQLFYKFQRTVSLLIIPMGVGIFCYSDLITKIMLGDQWLEISSFLGLWGLTNAFVVVLSHYSSEVYRSKGRPKLSVLSQCLHIVALWPAVLISIGYGFETLCVTRALIRFEGVIVNMFIMFFVCHISPQRMLSNILPSTLSSFVIVLISYFTKMIGAGTVLQFCSIIVCVLAYFGIVYLFPQEKMIMKNYLFKFIKRVISKNKLKIS